MAQALEVSARQTLFLVKDAPSLQKVTWPGSWQIQHSVTAPDLQLALQKAQSKNQRTIVVLSEEDYLETLQVLKAVGAMERRFRFGLIIVASEGTTLLRDQNLHPEVLDILSDKEFLRATEFHLLRSVRQLWRNEERANQRVSQKTLEHLNQTFISLSAERNAERLLASIVLKGKELASAEGGSLYMVAETDGDIFFKLRIRDHEEEDVTIQHTSSKVQENSVCGYVALTAKILNIQDVSTLRPLTLPQFNKSIDHHSGVPPQSLLSVPLKNSRNEIIGVLQLANKQNASEEGGNKAFDAEDESLLSSFATQAAICLENVDLYGDIQRLFEGFVKASISAIESRDPSTGGHSERVAKICVALARATTECDTGIYRSVKFREEEIRELEYAAMLHDFGKIGVREEVLCKAKKLYTYQLDGIKDRIRICRAAAKIDYMEKLLKGNGNKSAIEREYSQRLAEIDAYWEVIVASNEPTILKRESIETLGRIRQEHLLLPDGTHVAVLTEDEYQALSVTKGSLTDSERLEIESHVRHTYQFLKMIPWTKDFRHLTEIAYCHHEKLDGTGYPRGLSAHEIPLQSKIMTIADIYDALTAADRWYKEAVPTQKALDILQLEVSQGKLDPVLFELFLEKKIYELTLPKDVSRVA